MINHKLNLLGDAGIVADTKQEDQHELHGRSERHDHATSTKQFLISSYRKNLYPALKAEIHQSLDDPIHSNSKLSSRSKYIQDRYSQSIVDHANMPFDPLITSV